MTTTINLPTVEAAYHWAYQLPEKVREQQPGLGDDATAQIALAAAAAALNEPGTVLPDAPYAYVMNVVDGAIYDAIEDAIHKAHRAKRAA